MTAIGQEQRQRQEQDRDGEQEQEQEQELICLRLVDDEAVADPGLVADVAGLGAGFDLFA